MVEAFSQVINHLLKLVLPAVLIEALIDEAAGFSFVFCAMRF